MKTRAALALLTLAALQTSLAQAEDTVTRAFKEPVTRVEVRNSSGSVRIHAESSTLVTAKKQDCSAGQDVEIRVEGSTLIAKVVGRRDGGNSCDVDFDLAVPANVAVTVDVGSGDVHINGIRGAVELKSGSGDAAVDAEVSELTARLGSGDLDIKGLSGSARVKVGSGDVKLTYKAVPAQGTLKVDAGAGDVDLKLPSQARFGVDFHSGAGRLRNALATTAGAAFVVEVHSGAGDLSIKSAN